MLMVCGFCIKTEANMDLSSFSESMFSQESKSMPTKQLGFKSVHLVPSILENVSENCERSNVLELRLKISFRIQAAALSKAAFCTCFLLCGQKR